MPMTAMGQVCGGVPAALRAGRASAAAGRVSWDSAGSPVAGSGR